ncbi:MAG: DNA polymerase III subunit alpha [Candidatus Marinimicrobia bacterium]|nr:DNA polymerase III subunit alpha [Candidatus Neomarinimicrobiota bacterium]|tara:strand:+ start:4703 stop:8143 length:3441 start_codon:yes stop_codon:yes gene_type:complete
MAPEFVHLHNHTDYSLLDGAQKIPTLINTVIDNGMDAVGVTEHGNMFSAISFYKKAHEAGIKPIIGCEVYVAQGDRFDKTPRPGGGWGNNHLLLIAQNNTGYRNLMKLSTAGYLEGFYYRPRVDKDLLKKYSEGIICLSACLKGEVQELAVKGDLEGAKKAAISFTEIFPNRFYLELMNHGIPEEEAARNVISKLAKELNIPLVATNDCHYAKKDHWEAHDIMFCLGTGKDRDDPKRQRYATSEFYFKTQDEMWKLFKDYPNALENTRLIADSCNLDLQLNEYLLPNFPIPDNSGVESPDDYLKLCCQKGLKNIYPSITENIQSRLNYELGVIKQMGFAGYFLIVMDFVKYAKDTNIPVGPGRGSVAGSLVAYALGITSIDPIQYNLLFERFLNPERISMPDIDIDFCYEQRSKVIEYIKDHYGKDSVTQIITFGKLKARQVVRDVGRVIGMPLGEVDKIAKSIPSGPGVSLDTALEVSSDLQGFYNKDQHHRNLINFSKTLEGMNRHPSTHAAGVVIAPGNLTDYIPLYKSKEGDITSQYDMKNLEDLGLLKMDFLGLRNLTVIDQTLKLLSNRGISINIETIPLDDETVLNLFCEGKTIGVFQFESNGMQEYLKKLKPTSIHDLIAMNALYRPGPMDNIDEFIKRKHGQKKIKYIHQGLERILKETYGIIVYQEQVMQIANSIAGFSLAQADMMRRAMGKKEAKLMANQREEFLVGALEKGTDRKKANAIFDLLEKFAQYGFNKSHSTAYALVAYQTAYLKAHHPSEFMAANLTSEMGNASRIVTLLNECRKLNLTVHPPDVNESEINFCAIDERTISFGLNAIKNVGAKALHNILDVRNNLKKFRTLFEFCEQLDLRLVNKRVIESLVGAGAMDSLEGNRAQLYHSIDTALKFAQQIQNNANENQFSIFGKDSSDSSIVRKPSLSSINDWEDSEKLTKEKELMGFYLTGHPLLKFADILEKFSNYDFSLMPDDLDIDQIRIGGIIGEIRYHFDKKNQEMVFFNLECLGGSVDVLAFHESFLNFKHLIFEDNLIFLKGRATSRQSDNKPKIIVESIESLEEIDKKSPSVVNLIVEVNKMNEDDVYTLFQLAKNHSGNSPLLFHLHDKDGESGNFYSKTVKVTHEDVFIDKLRDLYGKNNVWIEK